MVFGALRVLMREARCWRDMVLAAEAVLHVHHTAESLRHEKFVTEQDDACGSTLHTTKTGHDPS